MKDPSNLTADDEKASLEPTTLNIDKYMRQGAIGMVSGVIANTVTTPLYIAWTKKQFEKSMPTFRIFREIASFSGLKENLKVIKVNFPMSLRHALGFFTVVNTSMVYLEKTSYPSFIKGLFAGGISAIPETVLTYNATRKIVDIVGSNKTKKSRQLQILLFSMRALCDKSYAEKKPSLKLELQRNKRTFGVTLLKNGAANSLTMAFGYYFKEKLEEYQPGRIYNSALAGALGAAVASPFFMPFVVVQTVTLSEKNIDKSILDNARKVYREGLLQFWRGGFLRPLHKGIATGITFANMKILNDAYDKYLAPAI